MTINKARSIILKAYDTLKDDKTFEKSDLKTALLMGSNAIGVLEQYKWERDVAIKQLEDLGISLGQKIDGVYLTKEEYEKLLEYKGMYENLCR